MLVGFNEGGIVMRRVVLVLCVVVLSPAAHGIVLQISVNGDPDPVDSEIYLQPSGVDQDVYWFLVVGAEYGTITGGVAWPPWPCIECNPRPCEPGICENGIWGAISCLPGEICGPGIYVDEIIYHAEGLGDAVIELWTTPDFAQATLQDTVVIHQYEPECLKASAPEYGDWVAWGRPDCWCYARQCHGDADGCQSGPFSVGLPDLQGFKECFNRVDIPPECICYDFDHTASGPFRVGISDLNILKTWFNWSYVWCCDIDHDCVLTPEDKYNFWIVPDCPQ
jgi:hypothetical protein